MRWNVVHVVVVLKDSCRAFPRLLAYGTNYVNILPKRHNVSSQGVELFKCEKNDPGNIEHVMDLGVAARPK